MHNYLLIFILWFHDINSLGLVQQAYSNNEIKKQYFRLLNKGNSRHVYKLLGGISHETVLSVSKHLGFKSRIIFSPREISRYVYLLESTFSRGKVTRAKMKYTLIKY